MSRLVLKGHTTRGVAVIQLLVMLGAKSQYTGTFKGFYYWIEDGQVTSSDVPPENSIIFSLEEFEEKYPYKVGDEVKAWVNGYCGVFNIQDITWDSIAKEVKYRIYDYWHSVENLQPYKEESMEDKGTLVQIDFTRELRIADEVEVILGDYEFVLKDGKTYFVKKNKHPKTYEECCKMLGYSGNYNMILTTDVDNKLFNALYRLKVCRDAYWKIAGEEMGLGKPWEPDFTNNDEERYGIYTLANKVERDFCGVGDVNMVLSFPTEELRDIFYENFKELIEQCKELL